MPNVYEKLIRFMPLRVILRRHSDGEVEGLVEHSFSMGWDKKRVNIFWSGKAYSILGEHTLDAVANAEHNHKKTAPDLFTPEEFVVDPLDPDCPIEIDWEAWLIATDKFSKRNAPFKVKEKVNV